MKEQVTDISKVLQDMTEEMRLLRETVNQQYAEIIKLNRNINALNLQIRKKDTERTNLRERVAKYAPKLGRNAIIEMSRRFTAMSLVLL